MSSIKEKKKTEHAGVGVDDVVRFYADLFHNPVDKGFKESDSIKAAEFFTKYYNMLDKDSESVGTVIIVDDIRSVEDG